MSWLDLSGLEYFLSKLKSSDFMDSHFSLSESRYTHTTSASQMVSYTIPDFTPSTMTLDVYVNGLHCIPTVDYTLSGNVVSMVNELEAGQTIEFIVKYNNNSVKLNETRYTYTTSESQIVSFTIPNFSASTMTLDVYINGLHSVLNVDYILDSRNVVSMVNELEAGQTIEFVIRGGTN